MHAHGRVMSISATLQSWTETIGLAARRGDPGRPRRPPRALALALAGVALAAGLIGMTVVAARRAATFPV